MEYFILCLHEFDRTDELITAASSQREQEGLEESLHDVILLQTKPYS